MLPLRAGPAATARPTLPERLGEALRAQGVVCCQWKGHVKRARWESGRGDVDLLVDPAWAEPLEATLDRLGFKPALPPAEAGIPGTASWFGYDAGRGSMIHIHVQFRLIVGGYWTTSYRLPIERAALESAVPGRPFPVPAPELEFILFVLRQVQRYGGRDLFAPGIPHWLAAAQPEYTYLLARVDRRRLVARLAELLPIVDSEFFDACARSLRPGASRWQRLWLRYGLHRRLRPHACRPPLSLLLARIARRLHLTRRPPGMRLARGGTLVALVGGDGAGKSTCVAELRAWLVPYFDVMTAHLGRPPRSFLTLVVGGLLKLQRAIRRTFDRSDAATGSGTPGALELLRLVCTARDRYRLFTRARRFAAAGGIALCERYPIPQNRALVGPEIARLLGLGRETPLARRLMLAEQTYYRRITPPDTVLVLMVHPEIAVQRKTTEPPDYVRTRARIIWDTDWSATDARLVDAGQQLPQVLADLKTLVWAEV
jgi:hypothetical protein